MYSFAVDSVPSLVYTVTNQYDWVYSDSGTGAYTDFSIWTPRLMDGFYALGDVGKIYHSQVFPL